MIDVDALTWALPGFRIPTDVMAELAGRRRHRLSDRIAGARPALQEIIPIAGDIAAAIGSPVIDRPGDVAGNGYDYHGDLHRWLMLDFACWIIPHSPFVAFLLEVADAPSVPALQAALRSPASYAADFRLEDAWYCGPEVGFPTLDLADFAAAPPGSAQ